MSKHQFRIPLLPALLAAFFFVACDQKADQELNEDTEVSEEIDLRDDVEEPHGGPDGALGRPGCLRLLFPLTVDLPDGSTTEVANRQELRNLLKEWKADNPASEERPRIAFPHEIELPDGSVVTVSTPEQLRNFVRRCQGKPVGQQPRPCYQLVFPIAVTFPDGSSFEAATRKALADFTKVWRENHPGMEGHPEFVKPYQVLLRDGTLATIAEDGDLETIVADCRDERPAPQAERCFKLIFPVTLLFPDGRTAVTDNRAEMLLLIEAWRKANPNAAQRPAIAFPQDIELDGQVVEVQSASELAEIIGDCWEDWPFDLPCFRIEFPIDVELPNGEIKTVESRYEFARYLWLWRKQYPSVRKQGTLAYPITINYEDGSSTTINSPAEWRSALEACGD